MGHNTDSDTLDVISLLVEFLEVATHQILYTRRLYPVSIFVLKKKYNIPVRVSIHPGINSYIKQTLAAVKSLAETKRLQSFALTFFTRDCTPIEKHLFDILSLETNINQGAENDDPYLIRLQGSLRDYILKLESNEFKSLPEDSSFRLILRTTEQGSVAISQDPDLQEFPFVTIDEHEHSIGNRSLVPLHTISSNFFRIQTYSEIQSRNR